MLDTFSNCDRLLLVGDFHTKISVNIMDTFVYRHDVDHLVKNKSCFEDENNPNTIDIFLTNSVLEFQNIRIILVFYWSF